MPALPPFPWAQRDDVIAFDTPELTRVEYRLAPFGLRIVAAAIDRLILLAVLIVVSLLLLVAAVGLDVAFGPDAVLVLLAALLSAYALFGTVLLAVAEVRGGGQTWGKRWLGIRTLTLAGQPPGIGAALVRNLARVVDDLPPLWIVPTLAASRQRLGDLLAGTCVVVVAASRAQVDPIAWPAPSWRELAERRFELPPEAARRLVGDDLDLVEYVLRRAQLHQDAVRREAMLRAISNRYLRRLGLEALRPAVMADPRRFLGELGLMLRDRPRGATA